MPAFNSVSDADDVTNVCSAEHLAARAPGVWALPFVAGLMMMNPSELSSLEEALKKADAALVRVWNDVHEIDDKLTFEEKTHREIGVGENAMTDVDDDPVAIFLRQQALKNESEAKIQFEMWARVISSEHLSRWEPVQNEPKNEVRHRTPSGNQTRREIVKEKLVDELYRDLMRKVARNTNKSTTEGNSLCI